MSETRVTVRKTKCFNGEQFRTDIPPDFIIIGHTEDDKFFCDVPNDYMKYYWWVYLIDTIPYDDTPTEPPPSEETPDEADFRWIDANGNVTKVETWVKKA